MLGHILLALACEQTRFSVLHRATVAPRLAPSTAVLNLSTRLVAAFLPPPSSQLSSPRHARPELQGAPTPHSAPAMTRPHTPSGLATAPPTPDPAAPSSSSAAPGLLRRDHSTYDLPPHDGAYADDKDPDLERAYRSGSTSSNSAGSPLLASSPSMGSSSSSAGAKATPFLAHLGGMTRRIPRRALLAVLVGLAVVVSVLGAASSNQLGDAQVLEQLRSAKDLVQQSVADRWAAFRWHNGQDTDEDDGLEFEPLDPLLVGPPLSSLGPAPPARALTPLLLCRCSTTTRRGRRSRSSSSRACATSRRWRTAVTVRLALASLCSLERPAHASHLLQPTR